MQQAAGSQTKGVLSRCYQSTLHTRCENLNRLATLPGKGSGLFPPLAALCHLQERARERDAGRALAAPRPQRLETGSYLRTPPFFPARRAGGPRPRILRETQVSSRADCPIPPRIGLQEGQGGG